MFRFATKTQVLHKLVKRDNLRDFGFEEGAAFTLQVGEVMLMCSLSFYSFYLSFEFEREILAMECFLNW
jgi:hypothetical protein